VPGERGEPAVGEPALRKELTTFSLTALIIGAIIGSGIFFLPAAMLGQAGGAWPVMLAWVLGAIVAMSGGLAFAELGAAFPKAGGQYAFLRDSLGKAWAFQFAWSGFAVVQSGTIAAIAVALAGAVDYLVGLPGSTPCLGSATDSGCDGLVLPKWGVGFLAIAVIMVLTFVNQLGVRHGAWINNAAGLAKTGALLAIAAIYLLVTFAFFHVLPEDAISQEARDGAFPIAAESMDYLFGDLFGGIAATLVVGAVVVSTFGSVNTYVLTSPRIYHPIARDGDFPRPFGRLNRHGTPAYGLWYGAIWASLLTMTGGYVALANLVVFGLYVFYLATMVGYFVLRRKQPAAFEAAGFRMPLRPLPVVFFLLASVAVLASYLYADVPLLFEGRVLAFLASTTGMGLLLLGIGVVLYAVRLRQAAAEPSS
jgi:APA family basic amino acid/polyamine antiporter